MKLSALQLVTQLNDWINVNVYRLKKMKTRQDLSEERRTQEIRALQKGILDARHQLIQLGVDPEDAGKEAMDWFSEEANPK